MILLELPKNKSPYFYAAAEEWLVRSFPADNNVYVLLYVNEPCVVVGKNQCVWKEVNWSYLKNPENRVVRRVSGGGSVYHDTGNLCFSFIAKFENDRINNYKWFNQPIIIALQKMGINAVFSERNDILLENKKISGNAQFTNRKNILSHGTILFDADLKKLRNSLKANNFLVESKAVSSVRSSVMNLNEKLQMSFEKFCAEFQALLPIARVEILSENAVEEIEQSVREKYATFDWIYAKSPTAYVRKKDLSFTVENGLLRDLQTNCAVLKQLENQPFLSAVLNDNRLQNSIIELLFSCE